MTAHDINQAPDAQFVREVRHRQDEASTEIAMRLAPLAGLHPELWTDEKFLLILGIVYEQIMFRRTVAPGEIYPLIKSLVERGRLKSPDREPTTQKRLSPKAGTADRPNKEDLGTEVRRLVRQIYGVDLQFHDDNELPETQLSPKPAEYAGLPGGEVRSKP